MNPAFARLLRNPTPVGAAPKVNPIPKAGPVAKGAPVQQKPLAETTPKNSTEFRPMPAVRGALAFGNLAYPGQRSAFKPVAPTVAKAPKTPNTQFAF